MKLNIFVPTKDNEGKKIAKSRRDYALQKTEEMFCSLFGGYSSLTCFGGCINESGKKIVEKSTCVYTLFNVFDGAKVDKFYKHVIWLKRYLKQESILVVKEQGAYPEFI